MLRMLQMAKCLLQNQKGQGMVEYGLILALIAIVVIGVLTTTGTNLSSLFTTVSGKLTSGGGG